MGYVRKKTGIDLTGDESLLGRTLQASESLVQKLGNTIESIVSDPRKLAAVGIMVAFPGAASAVGDFILGDALAVDSLVASGAMTASEAALAGTTALGSGSAASAIVGQAAINAATNGGNVEQAVKAALIQQGLPAALKSDVMQSLNKDMVDVLGKYGAQATTQAGLAAIMGKDPVAAFVFSGASSAAGLITQQIPGFSNLPEAAQRALTSSVVAGLTGKDASTAAASSLVTSMVRGAQTAFAAAEKTGGKTILTGDQIKAVGESQLPPTSGGDPRLDNVIKYAQLMNEGKVLNDPSTLTYAASLSPSSYAQLEKYQMSRVPAQETQTQTQPQEPPSQGGIAQLAQTQAPVVLADTGISSLAPVATAAVIDAINTAADTQQAQTQEPPAQGGIEQLAETQPETIVPPTQQLAQETTGGLDQLINAINNPETTSSYTGTNVADVSGGITGLPLDQPTDQDLAQLGVGLPTGLTDTTDQGGVDVGDGGISSLLDQGQTGNRYQQGEGAFTGIDTGTVASDQTTGGTGMDNYDLGGFEGIDLTGGQGDTYQAGNEEEENLGTIPINPIDAGQGEGAFPGTEPGTVASDQPGGDTGLTPSMWQQLSTATGLPVNTLKLLGAGLGAAGLGSLFNRQQTAPAPTPYTGPLSNITFNPATYTPYTYKPYAGGGAVESMSNANAIGANTGFPMADIQRGAYSTPYQQPISQNVVTGDQDTRVDPYTGAEMFASGGIANLGGYSDGGRLLRGPGDGVSDSIPAMIGNRQPARLADGEFVIPARIVSEIGNGSTDAGARKLYEMMDRVQAARRKTTGKGKFAANTKADKYLPT